MDYSVAMEDKSNAQAEHIIELEDSVDVQTVFTEDTYFAARAVSTGANKELTEIRVMMKQLEALVTVTVRLKRWRPSPPRLPTAAAAAAAAVRTLTIIR